MENQNIASKNIQYDFKSTTSLDEKAFLEFGEMGYFRVFVIFVAEFVLCLFATLNYNIQNFSHLNSGQSGTLFQVIFTGLILLLMITLYFKTQSSQKNAFKKTQFVSGEQRINQTIYFGNRIITNQKNSFNDFDYTSIIAIYESEKYYYLKMQYNICLIVNKNLESNLANVDFIYYILCKSPNITNKKVCKATNYKLLSFIFMCMTALLFVINIAIIAISVASVFFQFNNLNIH